MATMKRLLIFVLLIMNVASFSACKHVDKKSPDKDKGPIYMRPIHHSKDTAQA